MPAGSGSGGGTTKQKGAGVNQGHKSNAIGALISLALAAPPTPDNIRGFNAWIAAEKPAGEPMQWNNPLNTSDRWHHSGIYPVGPGISIFPDPATGIMAQARTIRGLDGMRGWPHALAAIKAGRLGKALEQDAELVLDGWGTSAKLVREILAGGPPMENVTGSVGQVDTVSGGGGGSSGGGGGGTDSGTSITGDAEAAGRAVVAGLSWPFGEGAHVLETLWKDNPLSAIASAALFFANPHNWLRAAEVVAGFFLLSLGLFLISWHAFRSSGPGRTVTSATKSIAKPAIAAFVAG